MTDIKDISLAPEGRGKIAWVKAHMPVMAELEREFTEKKPLAGLRLSMSIHLEAKTARLALALRNAGAEVAVTGSNPLSTQDCIAAALAEEGLHVYGIHGATDEQYNDHIAKALSHKPHIIIDDGGDLTYRLHTDLTACGEYMLGGSEETTTGVIRLRSMEREGVLRFPMIDVNDADCKHLFDNRYGTGQSVITAIMAATNLLLAGKTVVIAGYGWCGRGAAMRASGMGANVIITEVDPIKAIEAVHDGYRVMTMDEAAPLGDVFITVTGCKEVIRGKHMAMMKDGVLLANAGHFDVEICKPELEALCIGCEELRAGIASWKRRDGAVLNLMGEGRLVNLCCGDGHPAEIMDLSFALQALSACEIVKKYAAMEKRVYGVSRETDRRVAEIKLNTLGVKIDKLTEEQERYLDSWQF